MFGTLNLHHFLAKIALSMTKSTSSATAPTVQPWENTSSPYFLSSGDNPSISLVVQALTEENYST